MKARGVGFRIRGQFDVLSCMKRYQLVGSRYLVPMPHTEISGFRLLLVSSIPARNSKESDSEEMLVSSRVFVVTGASSGLGLAVLKDLLSNGARAVLALDMYNINSMRSIDHFFNSNLRKLQKTFFHILIIKYGIGTRVKVPNCSKNMARIKCCSRNVMCVIPVGNWKQPHHHQL